MQRLGVWGGPADHHALDGVPHLVERGQGWPARGWHVPQGLALCGRVPCLPGVPPCAWPVTLADEAARCAQCPPSSVAQHAGLTPGLVDKLGQGKLCVAADAWDLLVVIQGQSGLTRRQWQKTGCHRYVQACLQAYTTPSYASEDWLNDAFDAMWHSHVRSALAGVSRDLSLPRSAGNPVPW